MTAPCGGPSDPPRTGVGGLGSGLDGGGKTWRREAPAVLSLLLLGSLAFYRLLALPAFEDEGTQLRWIFRAIDAGEWLQPLDEGRPLQVWPLVPLVRLAWLGGNPLVVMRAMNTLAGMTGAVLTYRVATRFGDRWTAWMCGVLFAVCPFVVYLQRLALADMFLCTAGLCSLLCALRFIESPSHTRATLLASSLVLAALSKLPVGFVLMALVPIALVFLPAAERGVLLRRPLRDRLLYAHGPVVVLAALVTLIATVRVHEGKSPGFGLQTFAGMALGAEDVARGYGVRGVSLAGELSAQLSWPVVAVALSGIVATAVLGSGRDRWLLAVGALPMLGIALLARFWFSRYLLFTLPPLIISAVTGWKAVSRRIGGGRLDVVVFAGCLVVMGRRSALLIVDPQAASWSRVDRIQYIEGGGSGYGYPEAARFILASHEAPAAVYSLDGHSAYQLQSHLPSTWRGRVKPIFFGKDGAWLSTEAERANRLLESTPTWIVAVDETLPHYLESTLGASRAGLSLPPIATFDKPGARTRVSLWGVTAK